MLISDSLDNTDTAQKIKFSITDFFIFVQWRHTKIKVNLKR